MGDAVGGVSGLIMRLGFGLVGDFGGGEERGVRRVGGRERRVVEGRVRVGE
jgi:hypothetical protein